MAVAVLAFGGCQAGGKQAPDASTATSDNGRDDERPYDGIAPSEVVRFTGTEPFWGGEISGETLTYSTPDRPDGDRIAVKRFAGRGGISWTGTFGGARFSLAVTPLTCSDGMSDRTYPFTATLDVMGNQRSGCAWTVLKPFSGPDNP